MPQLLISPIEDNIPLPISAVQAMPELNQTQELEMRSRTLKLLSDLSGVPIQPTVADKIDAEHLAKDMIANPDKKQEFFKYNDETIAYLAGMVAQSNVPLVEELTEFKQYIITKLVGIIETTDNNKDRLSALKTLGEVQGVDAFMKRTEITVQHKPIEEVEKELLTILDNVKYKEISDAELVQPDGPGAS
jgi:hypothetical protein